MLFYLYVHIYLNYIYTYVFATGPPPPRAAASSAPLEPSGSCSNFERLRGASSLDQAFRARQRSQKCWQVHRLRAARPSNFERPGGDERPASSGAEGVSSGAEGARAAISNAPAEPRWLDVANVGRCGVFAARPSQLIELLN